MSIFDNLSAEINDLNNSLNKLDIAISSHVTDDLDYRDVAELMFAVYTAKSNIALIYDSVSALLDKAMKEIPEVSLDNGVKIEKKIASDRRAWKHKDLASEIAHRLIMTNIDIDTGETNKSTEELMAEMLRFLQPSYWRVKELSTIGINADNYCEVLEPKTSIIVRKSKDNKND